MAFGVVFYEGPSMLTGDPVVGIAIGLDGESMNSKTGPMAQVYVLLRDVPPTLAKKQNRDDAICGDCCLRGRDGKDSGCYVTTWYGPEIVWKGYQAGKYPVVDRDDLQAVMEGQLPRLTAYGDIAALPLDLWADLLYTTASHVAYTHQWETCDPWFQTIAMASVHDEAEGALARSRGWRTYRIRRTLEERVVPGEEFVCPASDEGGQRATCVDCRLCGGTSTPARSVVILVHGKASNQRAFFPLQPVYAT